MESLDLLANNVANASSGGYKADREFYSLYVAPEADSGDVDITMPLIERPWVDLSQGVLHATGNPLDLALDGSGFFSVEGPSGPLYTRNGSFQTDAGGRLTTAEGFAVRSTAGAPIILASDAPVEIDRQGTVRQSGRIAGQLDLMNFANSADLLKQGRNYFRAAPGTTGVAVPGRTRVEQGKVENSNAGAAESAVRLVSVMRQFEMLQKAATLGAEMNRRAIEEVAKVGA